MALETFRHRLEDMDYIEKDQPEGIAFRLRSCLKEIETRLLAEKREVRRFYSIQVFDEVRHIPIDEILHIETSHKQHKLVLHSDRAIIEYTGKLNEVAKSLGDSFWRIHRSYLVSRGRVQLVSQKTASVEWTTVKYALFPARQGATSGPFEY